MKIFVGTMASGEGDMRQCIAAIKSQQDVEINHVIISGLPEAAAHEQLYTTWNEVKHGFDLFLKVDADTILTHSRVAHDFALMFEAEPRLTGVQAWLHDYMTDSKIYGLTCLRNTVTLATRVDPLYCDRVDTGHDIIKRGDVLPQALNPAGYHCHYSTAIQAFRYGVHRAKKNQHDIAERVKQAWLNDGKDRIRGYAILGFQLAAKCQHFDYDSSEFQSVYYEAQHSYDALLENVK